MNINIYRASKENGNNFVLQNTTFFTGQTKFCETIFFNISNF